MDPARPPSNLNPNDPVTRQPLNPQTKMQTNRNIYPGRCAICGTHMTGNTQGPPRVTCSQRCRTALCRQRRRPPTDRPERHTQPEADLNGKTHATK